MRTVLLLAVVLIAPTAALAADTLVLCPQAWQPVLGEWLALRERQGHTLVVETPRATVRANRRLVEQVNHAGKLQQVMLVGDVAVEGSPPCGYEPLKIIRRWGPDKTVATDYQYADIAGDTKPEFAVGRIPVSSSEELRRYLGRVVEYETTKGVGTTEKSLSVVASPGNFSPWLDRVLEATATRVLTETTPEEVELKVIYASPASRHYPGADKLHAAVRTSLQQPALAWVYLGHGLPYGLDVAKTAEGIKPLLDVNSLGDRSASTSPPIATMLACYTGAFDARRPCLAETMLISENGPLAVIAASRVTMPYGNSILGLELLERLFAPPEAGSGRHDVGGLVLKAKQRALDDHQGPGLRATLEQIAAGVTSVEDRQRERLEHAWAYNLLGDPLLTVSAPGQVDVAEAQQSALR